MSTKHTPGPWAFSRRDGWGDTRFYIAQADGAPYTPNYSDVATLVAETCISERAAIQEANARLIAAAPELLEALRDTLDFVERHSNRWDGGNGNHPFAIVAAARAAIAKATGA